MQSKLYIWVLCVLLFHFNGNAQNEDMPKNSVHQAMTFHLIDVESGLSNNYINSIEEDDIGRIWIATSDGLNRYDGAIFKHYKTRDSIGLKNNNISQLYFDNNTQNLLLATDGGMNSYDLNFESFDPFHNTSDSLNSVVNCFTRDSNGKLFMSYLRSKDGLYVKDNSGGIQPYWKYYDRKEALTAIEISSLALQNDSILWIGTFHSGLIRFDLKQNRISRFTSENSTFTNNISAIYIDKTENIWVGTKQGLFVLSEHLKVLELNATDNFEQGLSDKSILSINEDNQGRIWIGTRNGGLNILHKSDFLNKGQVNIKWYLPKTDGSSVFNRTVSCIKKDHNGNMWLGTSTGVNFVNPKDEPVKLVKHSITDSNSLSHDRIGALAQAKDGKIWIGTDGGGLDLFDPKTNSYRHFSYVPSNAQSLSNNYIISVLEDSQNRVWVGTYQGGINLLNPDTGRSKTYLPQEDIRVIFEDNINQIWVGTNRAGLYKYDEENDYFQYIDALGKIDIRDIEAGHNNSLWLATYGDGLIQFFPEMNSSEFFNTKTINELPTDVFFSIELLNNGQILIGSRYEGLIVFDPNTKSISKFTEKDGLSNNSVVSILQENEEFYWLGTNNGINRYSISTHKTYNLSTLNNIQTSAFNINSALKTKDGHLYFGGNKGLNIFYPDRLDKQEVDYKLIFNKISVLNSPVHISKKADDPVLKKSISYAATIHLKHDQSLFSLGYTVIKYPQAKNINYSYILEGYHDQWISTDGLNEANFSNTPPGDYTLSVKATLDSGEEITSALNIIIDPPFWKTLPAYALYLMILIVLIYFGMTYYSERVRLKNSLLFEKKQRQLEHELNEERMLFFTNFSHELKTPLTLILAPLDELMAHVKSQKHRKNIQILKKNAELLYQYISKLLEFRKSETGHSHLELQKCNINQVIHQIENAFKPLANKNNIDFKVSVPSTPVYACVDLEKFQIIMNNLVSNAFKYSKKEDQVMIDLRADDKHFKVAVRDTGAGIDPKDLPFIFNWYYQAGTSTRKKGTGVGLALSKNFVELHNGNISVKNNTTSSGVSFTINMPINEHLFSEENKVDTISESEKTEMIQPSPELYHTEEKSKRVELKTERKLILLVDDNPDILSYLESLLAEEYDLIFASDGQEGIEKAIEYIPNIIISDVMMPNKTGVELCHYLKNEKSTSHVPIILLTAKGNTDSVQTGYEEGADDYVTKPFNSAILKSRVKNLLNNREKLKTYFTTDEPLNAQLSSSNLKLIDKEKKFLMDLKALILSNLKENEDFNVDTLAQEIGMSRSSLYRKLNAMTGGNINDFIRKVKLEKAAYLIKHEGLSISQASFEVGFNSVNYFRKIFKKEFGSLPSEYKENDINVN
jgi:ligand-binding sensor domain-containing protein/signal transduction histidine kinase/DNA-binding response OmpR family regulator